MVAATGSDRVIHESRRDDATQARVVPTITAALSDPTLTADTQFATFLKIYGNPGTATTPVGASGKPAALLVYSLTR